MTAELNVEILHQAGIGAFFRPSQLEPLGIPYHRLRQLEADEAVERVGWGLYRLVGREAALEALREALRDRKVTTAALARTLEVLPSRRLRAILEAGVL